LAYEPKPLFRLASVFRLAMTLRAAANSQFLIPFTIFVFIFFHANNTLFYFHIIIVRRRLARGAKERTNR
jgi:hypothetical protein